METEKSYRSGLMSVETPADSPVSAAELNRE